MHTLKFITLPIAGAALRMAWARMHPLLIGFVKAQCISMAAFMAFLLTHAPVRLCNNYLIDDQWRLGWGFLWLAVALAITWIAPLFQPRPYGRQRMPIDQTLDSLVRTVKS